MPQFCKAVLAYPKKKKKKHKKEIKKKKKKKDCKSFH